MNHNENNEPKLVDAQERYLCFSLGNEEYAIPLLMVREVIAVPETTPVPFAASHFLGIMNLRGQIISVIDLRTKLGIKPVAKEENAVIICDLGTTRIGVVIDSVNSVISPKHSEISERPDMQTNKATTFVTGVYRKTDHLILLLDIAKALDLADYKTMADATKQKLAS